MKRAACLIFLFLSTRGLAAQVRTGLDVWEARGFAPLQGKRVGVICNHASVDSRGRHIVDVLRRAEGVTVKAVFTPEHGFSGAVEGGRAVANAALPGTDIPVFSLYGETLRPTRAMLTDIDALVFDIQDVGARFYTYITTLGYCMEEAARSGIPFYVLDRPNPAGGDVVEGEILDPSVRHFTAYYSIPTRHGLTIGEMARWHNEKSSWRGFFQVIAMEGYSRAQQWQDTGLSFVPPSPNIKTPAEAILYAGIGAFESTNVSVGRGTSTPFELFGAPWMDGARMAKHLNALGLPGAKFKAVAFTPKTSLYAGEKCRGVRVLVSDRKALRPVDIFVHAVWFLRDASLADFQPRWEEMPRVTGSVEFQKLYSAGAPVEDVLARIHKSAEAFVKDRRPYLIYRP